jgi:putative membrane protein
MVMFSANDKERIARAIQDAETRTSGEIVAVVAGESSGYHYTGVLWAALAALTLPLLLIYVPQLTGWHFAFQGPERLYLIQLLAFIVLAVILQHPVLRYALTPRAVKRARAHQNAREQFVSQDMASTEQRTGVLIFVSLAERYVEVLADKGIAEKVDRSVWQRAVDALTSNIAADRPAEGFLTAIRICSDVLAEHFPPGSHNDDELPNHLIVLD